MAAATTPAAAAIDSGSFTIAEYNWHANGGGFGTTDYRTVAMSDFAGAYLQFIR